MVDAYGAEEAVRCKRAGDRTAHYCVSVIERGIHGVVLLSRRVGHVAVEVEARGGAFSVVRVSASNFRGERTQLRASALAEHVETERLIFYLLFHDRLPAVFAKGQRLLHLAFQHLEEPAVALVWHEDAARNVPFAACEERHAALRKFAEQRRREHRSFAFDYYDGDVFDRYFRRLFLLYDEVPMLQGEASRIGDYDVTPAHAAAFLF